MFPINKKENVLRDICLNLDIWEDPFKESNDFDNVPRMNEFINRVPSTEDLQMHSVQHESDILVSNNNLSTDNTTNLSFSSDFNSSENSSSKISTQNILIGGADYEPSKNFDEVEYSVLSQDLGSNKNMGGSLDRSYSNPTLIETLVPSIISDTKPEYTILNALKYEELTPVFTLPHISEYKGRLIISYINASTSFIKLRLFQSF